MSLFFVSWRSKSIPRPSTDLESGGRDCGGVVCVEVMSPAKFACVWRMLTHEVHTRGCRSVFWDIGESVRGKPRLMHS